MIAPKEITVTIDGKKCVGTQGQTILEIASANGITIPTLCFMKNLSPWGGCRMCIVEIAGSPKAVPSCATPAADGSTVVTNNDRLQHLRKLTLELLFSERNHVCPICPMNKGDCDLQQQGYKFGIDAIRYQKPISPRKIIPEILKGLQLADIFADYSVADVELMMEQMKKFTPSDEIFGDDDDADADEFTLK